VDDRLGGCGGVAASLAWGALQNLWSDYKDGETSTYLLIGVPALLVAIAALYGAVQIARRGSR
jgi:hypothetical protein